MKDKKHAKLYSIVRVVLIFYNGKFYKLQITISSKLNDFWHKLVSFCRVLVSIDAVKNVIPFKKILMTFTYSIMKKLSSNKIRIYFSWNYLYLHEIFFVMDNNGDENQGSNDLVNNHL